MRAVVTEDFGAPAVLREVPDREAGPGEILIRVETSSLNGFDIAVAGGMLKDAMKHHFPVVLGRDFAGTVVTGGERFSAGDQVFGNVAKGLGPDGSFAELVALPESKGIGIRPTSLDIDSAGALTVAGLAALACFDAIDASSGDTVLIAGATGGVGSFLIQLLTGIGARVIATAKPGEPTEFVRDMGAAEVVDYAADLQAQVRVLAPNGVDAAVHLAGDGAALAGLVADNGRFASTIGVGPDVVNERGITATAVGTHADEESLARLASLVTAGSMRVVITCTYTLDEVPRAIAEFSGTLGKAAITIS